MINETFSKPQFIRNKSLRDLILTIRRSTKKSSGEEAAQIVDFHETLEWKVYFHKKEIKNSSN